MFACVPFAFPPIHVWGIFGDLPSDPLRHPHEIEEKPSFSLILGVLRPWFWTTAKFLCWGQVDVLQSGTCSCAVGSRKAFSSFICSLPNYLLSIYLSVCHAPILIRDSPDPSWLPLPRYERYFLKSQSNLQLCCYVFGWFLIAFFFSEMCVSSFLHASSKELSELHWLFS